MCSHSFHPQQSLAQAVPLLLHLLNRKKVAHPTGYTLLARKSCYSSPVPHLSPGRVWSVSSSLHPQKQQTPALLSFSKYSLPKRSEQLKDVSFPSLCLVLPRSTQGLFPLQIPRCSLTDSNCQLPGEGRADGPALMSDIYQGRSFKVSGRGNKRHMVSSSFTARFSVC